MELHESIQILVEFLPAAIVALEDLQEEDSTKTATKTHLLICVLTSLFVVTIVSCAELLSLMLELSRELESPTPTWYKQSPILMKLK